MTRLPTDLDLEPAQKLLEKHAADVGMVALTWNALHEVLGELFVEAVDPNGRSVVLAVWQAVTSDRSKRMMLNSALAKAFGEDAKFTKEIKWINDQLNNLEDKRNDAVHSPYILTIKDGAIKVIPYILAGNTRARKLQGKELALELQSYSSNLDRLKNFAFGLIGYSHRATDLPTWPQRPALPRPSQAMVGKSHNRQTDQR